MSREFHISKTRSTLVRAALPVLLSLAGLCVRHAAAQVVPAGQVSDPNAIMGGYSSLGSYSAGQIQGSSGAPTGVTQLGSSAAPAGGQTPGSTLGLLQGGIGSARVSGTGPSAISSGLFTAGGGGGLRPFGPTPFGGGYGPLGAPSTFGYPLAGGASPASAAVNVESAQSAGAAINLNSPLEPVTGAPADTTVASVATLPARERVLVKKAIARFNSGLYRAATRTLRPTVEDERATPAVRQFYAITLFAQDRVSSAAYQLLRAAKENPSGFFNNDMIKQAYRHNNDFASHLRRARHYCRHTHQAELGVLGAYYKYLAGHRTAAETALARIKPRRRDKACIAALRTALHRKIAASAAPHAPAVAVRTPARK